MSNFLIDEETDLLAAEFVLGTLDTEERTRAHSTLKTDPAFIAMVRIWERRFGELHLMVEPVDPDPKLWPRIKSSVASMGSAGAREPSASPDLQGQPAVVSEAPTPAEDAAAAPPLGAAAELETPAEASPAAQPASPAEPAPPATLPPAPDLVVPTAQATPGPDASALEAIIRSELASPPKAAEKAGEKAAAVVADRQPARQQQAATDVVRSRDRWRVFGMLMVLAAAGFAGLVAAWRFMPDRVPARLRPAELMLSIGIDTTPPPVPASKGPPPTSEFDE